MVKILQLKYIIKSKYICWFLIYFIDLITVRNTEHNKIISVS